MIYEVGNLCIMRKVNIMIEKTTILGIIVGIIVGLLIISSQALTIPDWLYGDWSNGKTIYQFKEDQYIEDGIRVSEETVHCEVTIPDTEDNVGAYILEREEYNTMFLKRGNSIEVIILKHGILLENIMLNRVKGDI